MNDLNSLVPPHEPAEDALAFAGKAALSMVPLVGSIATEVLAHALYSRQIQRQHEFNVAVARALTQAAEDTLTVDDIVGSDEFIAALTRAQRSAAETADEGKRRRLATAVAHGGGWAPFTKSEREQFTRLVDDFDEVHVWLLHYFADPTAWLSERGRLDSLSNIMLASVTTGLAQAFEQPESIWGDAVRQAAGDLDRNGLASIPLTTMMGADGILAQRTSTKGLRFLEFVSEPDHGAANAPRF